MRLRVARKIRNACIHALLDGTDFRHNRGQVAKALKIVRGKYGNQKQK